jgi:hypothetical protein
MMTARNRRPGWPPAPATLNSSHLPWRSTPVWEAGRSRPDPRAEDMTGTQGTSAVLHPVSDLGTAKEVYGALLGVRPRTDESY